MTHNYNIINQKTFQFKNVKVQYDAYKKNQS